MGCWFCLSEFRLVAFKGTVSLAEEDEEEREEEDSTL